MKKEEIKQAITSQYGNEIIASYLEGDKSFEEYYHSAKMTAEINEIMEMEEKLRAKKAAYNLPLETL